MKIRDEQIIDTARWLEGRVDELIEAQRFEDAIRYLRKLVTKSITDDRERQCATYLGYLYLMDSELDKSRHWLHRARTIEPTNPHVSYALGHVAMGRGDYAVATLRFLEAFVEAEIDHDGAEFLRSAALAMLEALGPVPPVASMLLGALERDLGNPWILDALARVYAADQRWMDSLEILSTLSDVVHDAAESMVVYRAPTARQLLRNRLMGQPACPEELEQRARRINKAVRDQFEVVLDARQRRGPTQLASLRFPTALSRLVRMLEWRDRGLELVELAQVLWARSSAEGFDEILGRPRLAAAIHVLVERLRWRVPTPLAEIARLHGAPSGAVAAAARVVAGRLGLELFDEKALTASLDFRRSQQFTELSRALLFGERLEDVRAGKLHLGGHS